MEKHILIVSEHNQLEYFSREAIQESGYNVRTLRGSDIYYTEWQEISIDLLIAEADTITQETHSLLEFLRLGNRSFPIIFICGSVSIGEAVRLTQHGATDILPTPVEERRLLKTIKRIIRSSDQTGSPPKKTSFLQSNEEYQPIIGQSKAIKTVLQAVELVADTHVSVLITGESGTGKELVAREIHRKSTNANGPFIKLNCAAIPSDLLESELFGHKKGAFTGATSSRQGAFFNAHGGTIFLDEIGYLPYELQPKLLHAVEEKRISPLGARHSTTLCVRILAATNQDLEGMLQNGTFRTDLFHRLDGYTLHLPPLRERKSDIPLLIDHFSRRFCNSYDIDASDIPEEILSIFRDYSWPGNIRELRNIWERLLIFGRRHVISPSMLPSRMLKTCLEPVISETVSLDLVKREKILILTALKQCNWNQSESARQLGITRNTLRYRMKKYSLNKKIPENIAKHDFA